jgi:hypothetical protein
MEVTKPLTQVTNKYLAPLGVEAFVIGSGFSPRYTKDGDVVPSNDLDVMVDLPTLMQKFGTKDGKTTRKELSNFLQKHGLATYQAGVTVHTKVPLGTNYYQVDIKCVNNASRVAQFHRHEIPRGSPYKGVNKQMVMNTLASSQGMLWSPDEGLYKRDAAGKKAELLSDDWDTIAKYLLGKQASGKDLGSVESILSAIPDEKRRQEVFNTAKNSASWQAATPNVTEWFRRAMDMLK